MNKVILMGRLTRDPDIRYSAGENPLAIARFTLAVDRRFRKENETAADFIPCVAFGKTAELAEKYLKQGTRITISGRIQTGSYINAEGSKIYTMEVVIEEMEFAESKKTAAASSQKPEKQQVPPPQVDENGFMNIPEGLEEELPFN